MAKEDQLYCVAAEDRVTKKRLLIGGPYPTKEYAEKYKVSINALLSMKRGYKYFHVAKYPYKPKNR